MAEMLFNPGLIKKYDKSGPRYTSYPTAVEFGEQFTAGRYREIARLSNASARPLSLYFHIPFCDTVCFYCACNKIATKDRGKSPPYLERMKREIKLQAELFASTRVVEQLHFGGGTPTFLSDEEISGLMEYTRKNFNLLDNDNGEYSIEIDPREVGRDTISRLRSQGFNRMSIGVQDFEPVVQQAVNRIQTKEQTFGVVDAARKQGFHSISIDLIYGLPFQSALSFANTLRRILELKPDRLSIFNYAHLPHIFKPQRRINEDDLPGSADKLDILQSAMEILDENGYVYIGMDHFALPGDELAVAQREGTLYRNFQGYSTHSNCDLVGLGVSSISMVGNCYAQNVKTIAEYENRLDNGRLAIFRGVELDNDDFLRREIITGLICNFVIDFAAVEKRYDIVFGEYFHRELMELGEMADDGLLVLSEDKIKILAPGRFLIRNICMVFDKYLRIRKEQSFSKVI